MRSLHLFDILLQLWIVFTQNSNFGKKAFEAIYLSILRLAWRCWCLHFVINTNVYRERGMTFEKNYVILKKIETVPEKFACDVKLGSVKGRKNILKRHLRAWAQEVTRLFFLSLSWNRHVEEDDELAYAIDVLYVACCTSFPNLILDSDFDSGFDRSWFCKVSMELYFLNCSCLHQVSKTHVVFHLSFPVSLSSSFISTWNWCLIWRQICFHFKQFEIMTKRKRHQGNLQLTNGR